MKDARLVLIDCVCGWRGMGGGGDPCPRCGSKERKPKFDPQTPEFWRDTWGLPNG